ncbi:MAG: glyoxalase [Myxococcales bacterium]|nr:glyoxalase [Myxococcales bacterium]
MADRTYVTVRRSSGVAPVDGLHWSFKAVNRQQVRAAFAAGVAAGGRDDGGPGLRAEYHPTYYAAFMKDPDGNRIEIDCHQSE